MLRLTSAIILLTAEVIRLTREVIRLRRVTGLRKPGLVFVKFVSKENGMAKFALVLPTPGAEDVIQAGERELVISINGGEPVTQILSGSALESEPFDAEEDDIVSGSLVDIDDAKPTPLRSEPRSYELEVPDVTAPPQPGEIGLRKIDE